MNSSDDFDFSNLKNILDKLSLGTENNTKFYHESLLRIKDPYVKTLTALYVLSFMTSVLGNSCLLGVLIKTRRSRSKVRPFLLNIALCDILIALCCMPFSLSSVIYKNWIYGDFICRSFAFIQAVLVSASIFTLTTLSLRKSLGICGNLPAATLVANPETNKFHRRILGGVWFASFVMALPLATVTYQHQLFDVNLFTCQEDWTRIPGIPANVTKVIYQISSITLLYIVPLIFIIVAYVKICKHVLEVRLNVVTAVQPSSLLKQHHRIVRFSLVLISLFAVSWLPYHLMQLSLDLFYLQVKSGTYAHLVSDIREGFLWLALNNSAVNPIFIFATDSLYRRVLQRCFQSIITVNNNQNSSTAEQTNMLRLVPVKRTRDEWSLYQRNSQLVSQRNLGNHN